MTYHNRLDDTVKMTKTLTRSARNNSVFPQAGSATLRLTGPAPLFAQVRDAVRSDILSGALRPGDRLPSESALIERFGVSRITVRQAIGELQTSGLVQTVNGKGSFVTRPGRGEAHGPLVGVLEAMRRRGITARGKLLSHRTIKATEVVARELDLPAGTQVGAITVLRYRDEVPFVVGTTWCPVDTAERLANADLTESDVATAIAPGCRSRPGLPTRSWQGNWLTKKAQPSCASARPALITTVGRLPTRSPTVAPT
jgi:DNA-binding GntR family transcriptional regulator